MICQYALNSSVVLPSAGSCVKVLGKVAMPAALDATASQVMRALLDGNLTTSEVLQLAEALLPEGQHATSPNMFRNLDGLRVMAKLVELLVSVLITKNALSCCCLLNSSLINLVSCPDTYLNAYENIQCGMAWSAEDCLTGR